MTAERVPTDTLIKTKASLTADVVEFCISNVFELMTNQKKVFLTG